MALKQGWDTFNQFLVGVQGDKLVFPVGPVPRVISKEQGQSLSAWLAVLSFDSVEDAKEALDRVANT